MSKIPKSKLATVKNLYYAKQYSAQEIARTLDVSIHAVYYFMRLHKLKRRSFVESNSVVFKKKPPSFNVKKNLTQSDERLRLAGIMLYWGEGYKAESASGVDFANSDVKMVTLFLNFLRIICRIDESRLRILLYCYSDQESHKLVSYWSKKLSIPKKNFTKPYIKQSIEGHQRKSMTHGLVHVRYNDKKLLSLIMRWLEVYKDEYASVVERSNTRVCKTRA